MKLSADSGTKGIETSEQVQAFVLEAEDDEEREFLAEFLRAIVVGPDGLAATCVKQLCKEFRARPNEQKSG